MHEEFRVKGQKEGNRVNLRDIQWAMERSLWMGKRDNLQGNEEGLRKSPTQRLFCLLLCDPQNFISKVSFLEAKTLSP